MPGETLDIFAGDYFAGSVTLNQFGRGRFELRTPSWIDNPGDGQPIPRSFPTLLPDDVVIVGPFNVTMERKE